MSDVLVAETTTLPDGVVITLERLKRHGAKKEATSTFTQLRAYAPGTRAMVAMHVDDIGPARFRQYLDLVCLELLRQRARFFRKPQTCFRRPEMLTEFVHNMIFHGMFSLDLLNDVNGNQKISAGSAEVEKHA
jgi:hypothetical protein